MTTEQLLWNLLFAFLSAFAGTVFGVLWARQQWKRDRVARARQLRANLIKAFRFNLDRIAQCLDYLQRSPVVIPNFRLDTATPAQVLLSGRELFADEGLFDRFDWQRYQLDHINAKLDYLHTHIATGSSSHVSPSPLDSLLQHLTVTQRDITQLLDDYQRTT